MGTNQCPFTRGACDGGEIHANGTVGCGYKVSPDSECAWLADVPDGTSPRDFYNEKILEAAR